MIAMCFARWADRILWILKNQGFDQLSMAQCVAHWWLFLIDNMLMLLSVPSLVPIQTKKSFLYYYFFSSLTWASRLATAIGVLSVSKKQAIEPIEFQYCSLFLFGCPLPLGIIRHHPTLSSAAHSASQYFWPSLKHRDNSVWHCFWLPCLPYTSPSSPMEASKKYS